VKQVSSRNTYLATDPEVSCMKQANWRRKRRRDFKDEKPFRLYINDDPVGCVIWMTKACQATYNANLRALYCYQLTLGHGASPLMGYRHEKNPDDSLSYEVTYTDNGTEKKVVVIAPSKRKAREEAGNLLHVGCVIRHIEQIDDVQMSARDEEEGPED